jgi:dTDP-4-dehydrorhamnose reductase
MKVGITGATGLVGSRVVELLRGDFEFVPLSRTNGFDLAEPDEDAWRARLPEMSALLHLGAKTQVDAIEAERPRGDRSEAMRVHRDATTTLCTVTKERKIPLILVSTDFVFPANQAGPYPDTPAPTQRADETSWYGWTKFLGEKKVLGNPKNAVLRISSPVRARHRARLDHARRVLELYPAGKLYPLFDDQWFTPSFIDDVATSLGIIVDRRLNGIFHCASSDSVTPLEFGTRLLRATGVLKDPPHKASVKAAAAGRAPRPQRGGLATDRSRGAGMRVRTVDETIADFVAQQRTTT